MNDREDMECSERSVELLLPDFSAGRLDQPDRQRVETHLADCASCRRLLKLIELLSAGRESGVDSSELEDTPAGHLSARQIVLLYSRSDSSTEQELTDLGKHLAACPDCSAELTFLKSMEQDLRRSDTIAGPTRRRVPAKVFGIAAILLVTATTIWFWQSKRSGQISSGITVLRELKRGAAETPTVSRQSGRPFLRVDAPVPHNSKLYAYQPSIRSADGTTSSAPMTTDLSTPLVIHVMIDSRTLTDGNYDLAIREIDRQTGAEVTYHFPLDLRTSENP